LIEQAAMAHGVAAHDFHQPFHVSQNALALFGAAGLPSTVPHLDAEAIDPR
jgi:hypothetical protein